jgi:hypothetical protein
LPLFILVRGIGILGSSALRLSTCCILHEDGVESGVLADTMLRR